MEEDLASANPDRDPVPERLAEKLLELDRVLALLADQAVTPAARAELTGLRPQAPAARPELEKIMAQTAAFRELIADCGVLPLAEIRDIGPYLAEIRLPETWLPPRELLEIAGCLAGIEKIIEYRRRYQEEHGDLYPALAEVFADLHSFASLLRLLESSVGGEEEILDEASLELADIRRRIAATRRQLGASLKTVLEDPEFQPFIQDHLVTIRNQRYVLPLRTNFRGAIPGIIHDHSRSRQTCFVEPLTTVTLNNQLSLLLDEERQEEINILKMIAGRLRQAAPELAATLKRVFVLDQLQARARFAALIKGVKPRLLDSAAAGFILRQARHPLLVAGLGFDRVVPIDIDFSAGHSGLVISGANTGGKTVSLKTCGLLVLMARCGLLLPLNENSEVPLFARVYAAIGDEQNLAASLSTFSGHLKAVKSILDHADACSLALLDELGVGTDPREGAALAQAVLAELKSRRVSFMATTHYNDVKSFAYEEEGICSVAVAFDAVNFRPLYHLQYGVPGLSNALMIARNLGFSEGLLEQARSLLGAGENRAMLLATRLEKQLATNRGHEQELFRLKQEARIAGQRAERLAAEHQAAKEKLTLQAREEVAGIVQEARRTFKDKLTELETARQAWEEARVQLKNFSEPKPPLPHGELRGAFEETRRRVEEALPDLPEPSGSPVDRCKIVVGDQVMVVGQNKPASVLAVEKEGKRFTVLLAGNLKVSLAADRISRHLPGTARESTVKIGRSASLETSYDNAGPALGAAGAGRILNLVGKRVEEAAELIPPFIDQALLLGEHHVELIHGHGTGRLRQGVREILAGIPAVKNFYHPEAGAGGAAITVVEL